MAKFVRHDAWNSGGDFSNIDLLWYAKGVGKMMTRSLSDPASWWFFAAIHGEYVNPDESWYPKPPSFPGWKFIKSPPQVPTQPLPSPATQKKYWNKCQHGSWYFLPWHRGYLMALEAQLRADIVSLGGPNDWALPYWNYFGGANGTHAQMPPALALKTLPGGAPNPLYLAMRYGPDLDGNIYIPTDTWVATHAPDPNWSYGDVTHQCLTNNLYTGSNQTTPLPGFGGPQTGFSHPGNHPHGNIESNPHDLVHVYTGGLIGQTDFGLMGDPGTAALDPVFYLHHCNIDRMWAAWNAAGNVNPTQSTWLKGPAEHFVMPMPGSKSWVYTPADMTSLPTLDYTYEDMSSPAKPATPTLLARLQTLGASDAAQALVKAADTGSSETPAELLGASTKTIEISGSGATAIDMNVNPEVQKRVSMSLMAASGATPPDRVYLKLENVRGTVDSTSIGVYVDLPLGEATPDVLRAHCAGHVALFGLRRASATDGADGGAGLTFVLDISHIVDRLYVDRKLSDRHILVALLPRHALPGGSTVEVGRLSLYRQPN